MSTVVEQLQRARTRHRKIYFRPNAGNAGDALINVGFYSLAARVGLPYTEIADDFDYASINREDLLILSGGETIVPYWRAGSDLLRRLTQFNFPLLLMPQSIAGRRRFSPYCVLRTCCFCGSHTVMTMPSLSASSAACCRITTWLWPPIPAC